MRTCNWRRSNPVYAFEESAVQNFLYAAFLKFQATLRASTVAPAKRRDAECFMTFGSSKAARELSAAAATWKVLCAAIVFSFTQPRREQKREEAFLSFYLSLAILSRETTARSAMPTRWLHYSLLIWKCPWRNVRKSQTRIFAAAACRMEEKKPTALHAHRPRRCCHCMHTIMATIPPTTKYWLTIWVENIKVIGEMT